MSGLPDWPWLAEEGLGQPSACGKRNDGAFNQYVYMERAKVAKMGICTLVF